MNDLNATNTILWVIQEGTWTNIDAIATLLTLFLVAYGWYQNYKQNEKINICFLIDKKEEICIPTYLLRKHVTRAEIAGLLGFFRSDMDKNHKIAYLSTVAYLEDINKIQNSKIDKLLIEITSQELEQFKL